jgi:hypothetical protein
VGGGGVVGVGVGVKLVSCTVFHSKKDFIREKKIRNRKKERAARAIFFMKLNTKPLKFKCRLAKGGGGPGGGLVNHARHGYPHLVSYKDTDLTIL